MLSLLYTYKFATVLLCVSSKAIKAKCRKVYTYMKCFARNRWGNGIRRKVFSNNKILKWRKSHVKCWIIFSKKIFGPVQNAVCIVTSNFKVQKPVVSQNFISDAFSLFSSHQKPWWIFQRGNLNFCLTLLFHSFNKSKHKILQAIKALMKLLQCHHAFSQTTQRYSLTKQTWNMHEKHHKPSKQHCCTEVTRTPHNCSTIFHSTLQTTCNDSDWYWVTRSSPCQKKPEFFLSLFLK